MSWKFPEPQTLDKRNAVETSTHSEAAASLFLNGEPETARLILRDLVNATIGFEKLADETSRPSKSLHRMLSAKGNPTMENLNAIFNVLRQRLRVDIKVHTVPCH